MSNPQDIALVAAVATAILAAVAWLNHQRSRLNLAFVFLMLGLSLLSLQNYYEIGARTLQEFIFWERISNVYVPLLCIFMLFYVILLSGYSEQLSKRFWGISLRAFAWIVCAFLVLHVPFLLFTDILVEDYVVLEDGEFGVVWTRWMSLVMAIGLFMLAYSGNLLIAAFRQAKTGSRRNLIRLNIIGVLILCTVIPFAPVILAILESQMPDISTISIVFVSLIFYFALNRYQMDVINELNTGLEQKVEERTRGLRETQLQFIQSEKLAAVGKLAAGIAHEANTPVGAVSASANIIERGISRIEDMLNREQLKCECEFEPELQKYLGIVKTNSSSMSHAGSRLSELITNLRHFVRLDESGFRDADINDGLKITLDVLSSEYRDRIQVLPEYGDIPLTRCSPGDLNQAFMHLLQNSIEAIEGEGEITIRTTSIDGEIAVIISDTGRRAKDSDVERLFDVGFADAKDRVKSKMDLAIVQRIIEDHHGTISAERNPADGLTFNIRIPIVGAEASIESRMPRTT